MKYSIYGSLCRYWGCNFTHSHSWGSSYFNFSSKGFILSNRFSTSGVNGRWRSNHWRGDI
jgi:hypothetical protein